MASALDFAKTDFSGAQVAFLRASRAVFADTNLPLRRRFINNNDNHEALLAVFSILLRKNGFY